MVSYLDYLNMPTKIGIVIIGCFLIMQIIGEIIEFKGKVVPQFFKIRKIFIRRKQERLKLAQMLQDVKNLLGEVNLHYSEDNIKKRDGWIKMINDRTSTYDNAIAEITKNLMSATQALKDNTKLTEEMFIQSSRDRIIDFATKATNDAMPVSREEFNRIFKVYDKYERYLSGHKMTNGEVDINYRIIKDAYEERMKNHSFTEDIRGYR